MKPIDRIPVDRSQRLPINGKAVPVDQKSFKQVLGNELSRSPVIKFSDHARMRMRDRNIELSEKDRAMINEALDRAAEKGARESLLLLNNLALLVSVKNRTIITALDQETQSEKIFTNIDSAVILR